MSSDEQVLGRFTGWYRRTPVSLEFWEGVLTNRRLIWCFVGESFRSLLLRADMGTHGRDALTDRSPESIAAFDDRNVVVPLDALQSIRLSPGSRLRRSSLVVTWADDRFELEATKTSDPQGELVESLAADERLSHVEIRIEHSVL